MKPSRGTGDKGKTGLFSGERVSKTHARIEACGDVDELVSVMGALASSVPEDHSELIVEIKEAQSKLLAAGSLLGTSSSSPSVESLPRIEAADVEALEVATDRIHDGLPGLSGFLIPGGHVSASWAHVARAVCRRAERRVVALVEIEGAGSETTRRAGARGRGQERRASEGPDPLLAEVLVYLNRLSDYLFCVARLCNSVTGAAEEIWGE